MLTEFGFNVLPARAIATDGCTYLVVEPIAVIAQAVCDHRSTTALSRPFAGVAALLELSSQAVRRFIPTRLIDLSCYAVATANQCRKTTVSTSSPMPLWISWPQAASTRRLRRATDFSRSFLTSSMASNDRGWGSNTIERSGTTRSRASTRTPEIYALHTPR